MILSGTVAVAAFASSVPVLGPFGSSYVVVALTPNWLAGGIEASALTSSQFTATWQNQPLVDSTLTWTVNIDVAVPASAGCVTAGTLITRLRGKIPDNVYVGNVAQPDMDGKFRVSDLLGWLDDGVKSMTQQTGWTIDDWYAMAQVQAQPWYDVDPKWVEMRPAFSNQWPLDTTSIQEEDTIWPNTQGPLVSQGLYAYVRRLATNLEVGLFPAPNASDPSTTLSSSINPSGDDPIQLASTDNFLTFGYVRIDDEIIQYQSLVTTPFTGIGVLSRGVCGTSPAAHDASATVQHLGYWIKGKRLPADIVSTSSCVEVPRAWMHLVETYVIAQARYARNRAAEGDRLVAQFNAACLGINQDPRWKVNMGRIRAFGDPVLGPLYGRSPWGVIVP